MTVPLEEQLALWQATCSLRLLALDGFHLLVDPSSAHPLSGVRGRTAVEHCSTLDARCRKRSLTFLAMLPLRSRPPEDDAKPPALAEWAALYGNFSGAVDTLVLLHHPGAGDVARPALVEGVHHPLCHKPHAAAVVRL